MVVAVAVIGFALWDRAETEPDNQNEAQTYANATYGVEFDYPADHVATERTAQAEGEAELTVTIMSEVDYEELQNSEEPREGPPSVTVQIFENPDKLGLEEWIRTTPASNFQLGDQQMATGTISGVEARAYIWSGLYEGRSIALARNNHIYVFSAGALTAADPILAAYEQVVSTVQFTQGSGSVDRDVTAEEIRLQGLWTSVDDEQYTLEFIDNRFEERYEGDASVSEDGSFSLMTNFANEQVDDLPAIDIGPNDVFLKLNRADGPYYYKIHTLSSSSLEMTYLGGTGAPLRFRK